MTKVKLDVLKYECCSTSRDTIHVPNCGILNPFDLSNEKKLSVYGPLKREDKKYIFQQKMTHYKNFFIPEQIGELKIFDKQLKKLNSMNERDRDLFALLTIDFNKELIDDAVEIGRKYNFLKGNQNRRTRFHIKKNISKISIELLETILEQQYQ